MAIPETASSNYRIQQQIGSIASRTVDRLWDRMDEDFYGSWVRIQPSILDVVEQAQQAAAASTSDYLAKVAYETGQVDLPVARVRPSAFAGTAGDGRSLANLMFGSVTESKKAISAGATVEEALAQGGRWLRMTTVTAVADANREATSAQIAVRPAISGWVRMLNMPSCSRCILLAGKWFRWNEGFRRHPRCDCRHIPASENISGSMLTDPYEAFKSLTPEEQDKKFGRIEARAIRDGADIYRVVNLQSRGLATAKAARRYGTPSRLTIDDIYRQAGTRSNAIRLMTEEGYITGPQVAGGNLIGNANTDARVLAAGSGRGTFRIGGVDFETARSKRYRAAVTGQRDPLDRATMTAAERRIFDAAYRADWANRGFWPASVGANSADRGLRLERITDAQRDLIGKEVQVQINALPNQPRQVNELARRLGLI